EGTAGAPPAPRAVRPALSPAIQAEQRQTPRGAAPPPPPRGGGGRTARRPGGGGVSAYSFATFFAETPPHPDLLPARGEKGKIVVNRQNAVCVHACRSRLHASSTS